MIFLKDTLLPARDRTKNQTLKEPTGPYDREKLLDFLQDQALSDPDREDLVPFQLGTKRGRYSFFIK